MGTVPFYFDFNIVDSNSSELIGQADSAVSTPSSVAAVYDGAAASALSVATKACRMLGEHPLDAGTLAVAAQG